MATKHDFYTYRVTWSEEDQEYVGLCAEFPGLSWLDQSPEKALAGIRRTTEGVAEDMAKNGEKVPQPLSLREYSGKISLRITPEMHRNLTIEAAELNVSLNRLLMSRLST